MTTVGVIDYGMGNIRSVLNALDDIGATARVCVAPDQLVGCDKLLLPGVGAFGDAMKNLRERRLDVALEERRDRVPLLGICLGMQLLCKSSTEGGNHAGLGWIDAEVVALTPSAGLKVPHIGWNDLTIAKSDPLFAGLRSGVDVYFVHSFHVTCHDDVVAATCAYDAPFTAAFSTGLHHGTQFHPEKSQRVGLQILANFVRS